MGLARHFGGGGGGGRGGCGRLGGGGLSVFLGDGVG